RARNCGAYTSIARCGECGDYAEGTGKLVSLYPCGNKFCGRCSRGKATRDFFELLAAMEKVPKRYVTWHGPCGTGGHEARCRTGTNLRGGCAAPMPGAPNEAYAWLGVTVTLQRKPRAPDDVTIETLQRKLESLGRITKHLWKSH